MTEDEHIVELAKEVVKNWAKFKSFAWFEQPHDADNWVIINIEHRDSRLLDQSNADAIRKDLEQFTEGDDPDVSFERHSHWAVGWTEAVCIRVYNPKGEITEAFKAWARCKISLDDYPVLDEQDYSNREYDATIENIRSEAPWFGDFEPPDDWEGKVFSYLWQCNQSAVENIDDQGGYPSREQICEALDALGIEYEKDD